MIPKIIHYVWVGNNKKDQKTNEYIQTWKQHCKDYQFIEWRDDSLANINNTYVKQAYANKKWAFVSDYLRLYALYNFGGIYLDTDVEVTNNLSDFLYLNFFSGFELYQNKFSPITAVIGSEINNHIIKGLLQEYDHISFINNGEPDLTTNTARITKFLQNKYKLSKPFNGQKKLVLEKNSIIFPYYYFCSPLGNNNNYAIHHFSGSWIDGYKRKTYLKLGKYKLVKFRKNKDQKKNKLPLYSNESVLFLMQFKFRHRDYKLAIIRSV